ncbi:MAG: citrate/2-methylcitrate synthase [Planctomycetota bacterium]|jgi:citrate synthase
MTKDAGRITDIILEARAKAVSETSDTPEPSMTQQVDWPVSCTVGPGLEGAIACESEVGYVNGSKGWLIYRGYDIFDLCAHCTFEEVSFLLLHGHLPATDELAEFKSRLLLYAHMPNTIRRIMSFPLEDMHAMAALRLGTNLMRQEFTHRDQPVGKPALEDAIGSDEDSIPMETEPWGDARAIYEFHRRAGAPEFASPTLRTLTEGSDVETCYHLISGVSTLTAAIARIRNGQLPIEPDPDLGHAANFLYMLTGKRPTSAEERLMDVALILHADHGMNASTFAAMVVASTLSDIYLAVGSGIAALSGPLHGGANEKVIATLNEIGSVENVKPWFEKARAEKRKVMGFGHRVYKAYDPRARVLGPLSRELADQDPEVKRLFGIAQALEDAVVSTLGAEKSIFPNVDYYSGLTFAALGIPSYLFAPIFAVSRVAGWTARVLEYLNHNRIFRPRAIYVGEFGRKVEPIEKRE